MPATDLLSKLKAKLKSPLPPHAFVVERERLVYVGRRDAKGRPAPLGMGSLLVLSRALPAGTFREGPGGAPVAGAALAATASALAAESGAKITAASLVVPDDFVRVLAIEAEKPNESPKETEEVLRWRLARMFGDATPHRLAWQAAENGKGPGRLLAVAAPEEAVASWEAAFAPLGIRIGGLKTAALAVAPLASRVLAGDGFLVWAPSETATTVFFAADGLKFVRTKATADVEEALQEIRLASSFVEGAAAAPPVAESAGLDVVGRCAAGPSSSPVVERFARFRAENGGVPPKTLTPANLAAAGLVPPGTAGDDAVLLPALGAMTGGD